MFEHVLQMEFCYCIKKTILFLNKRSPFLSLYLVQNVCLFLNMLLKMSILTRLQNLFHHFLLNLAAMSSPRNSPNLLKSSIAPRHYVISAFLTSSFHWSLCPSFLFCLLKKQNYKYISQQAVQKGGQKRQWSK